MPTRAATDPPPSGPELEIPEASPRTASLLIALGVAFDLAFNGQRPGLSIPLFVLVLAAGLRAATRHSLETDVLLGLAVVVSAFPALRAAEDLIALDALAIGTLLALAVTQDVGALSSVTLRSLLDRAFAFGRRSVDAPRYLLVPVARHGFEGDRHRLKAFARAVAVVVPVLALFAGLLASGDRVFGRYLGQIFPGLDAGSVALHVFLTLVGVAIAAVLWRVARGDRSAADGEPAGSARTAPFSFAETAAALGGIIVLFSAFVFVQFAYLFGGRARVLVTPGLTYAEYARTGFFQLAAVAALTVVLILGAWDLGRRESDAHRRWFRRMVTVMVGLTGVILASALKRLALYEGAFGFTLDRFYGYVAIACIGGVLLVLVGAIWTQRRDRAVAAILAAGLAALLVVNVLGPERFVAERNVARFRATGQIDVEYLVFVLGYDAVPVTVTLLGRVPSDQASELMRGLCERLENLEPEPSWRSWNLARSRVRSALAAAGITATKCGIPPHLPVRPA